LLSQGIPQEHYDALNRELGATLSKIKNLEATRQELEKRLADLAEKNTALTSEISDINKLLSLEKSKATQLEARVTQLESTLAQLQNKAAGLETALAEARAALSETRASLSESHAALLVSQSRLKKVLDNPFKQFYIWTYKGVEEEWVLSISLSDHLYFRNVARPRRAYDYTLLVKGPLSERDSIYIKHLVSQIEKAAKRRGLTPKEKVEFMVAFVQSLPYTPDDVTTRWDEYPRFPLETLFERGGDCEDTSILMARLLDEMGYDTALLYFPYVSHMAVGVNLQGAQGVYWREDRVKYFYLETTREGWRVGEVPPELKIDWAYVYPVKKR